MEFTSSLEMLLTLFRRGVKDIGDDSDYYSKSFNEGIRLCYEEKRGGFHPSYSIVTAELILAFERYKQWKCAERMDSSLADLSLQLIERYKSKVCLDNTSTPQLP